MPRLLAVVVLCALGRVASADVDTTWDGTYTNDNEGPTYLCPHPLSVTVSNGAYSFAWTISTGNGKPVRVGTITGSVRASGLASTKATLLDPIPADALAAMKQLDEPLDKLTTAAGHMKLEFKKNAVHRSFDLSDGSCYADWVNDGPAPAAPAVKGGTAPAKVGPIKKLKPPPPLAAGAPKWDTVYVPTARSSQDWRCPKREFTTLVVSKGRFTMPYTVDARSGHGTDYGETTLGQIDGSIAVNGKVKLRTWFSVSELPPEITEGRKPNEATLDYVRAFALTMTFSANGNERHAKLSVGSGDDCEILLESKSTFKPGRSVATNRPKGPSPGDNGAKATVTKPAQAPPAQPPPAQPPPAQPKPAKAAKPTKPAAGDDDPVIYGNGVKWSKSRMNDVDDFESNKDSWDHGSIRKSRGNMSYGQITTAYRCDNRDGCEDKAHGWTAIGYVLEPR